MICLLEPLLIVGCLDLGTEDIFSCLEKYMYLGSFSALDSVVGSSAKFLGGRNKTQFA